MKILIFIGIGLLGYLIVYILDTFIVKAQLSKKLKQNKKK